MQLPSELRGFFALEPIEAKWLGICEWEGKAVAPHTLLWPRLAVLPMGAQMTHAAP